MGPVYGSKERTQIGFLEANFASGDLADRLAKDFSRVLLVQDAGHAGLNQLYCFLLTDARRDDEDTAWKPPVPGGREEVQSAFRSEVDVEQHHVRFRVIQDTQ